MCTFITKFRDDNFFDQLLEKLEIYESKDTEGRELFLHDVLTHGNLKKMHLLESKLLEADFACNNTLKNFFLLKINDGYVYKRMQYCQIQKAKRDMKTISIKQQNVIDFLLNLGNDEGELHATCFVQLKTTIRIRDLDLSLSHLPYYYSKRLLYETFFFQNGYKVKAFSDGLYSSINDEYKLRDHDMMVKWLFGLLDQNHSCYAVGHHFYVYGSRVYQI